VVARKEGTNNMKIAKSYIGIVGSRRRDKFSDYIQTRDKFFSIYKSGDWIVSGGCPQGGDRFAELLARQHGIPIIIFYPDWVNHGRAAGFVRNQDIADWSNSLIACVAEDRKGGTEDTIKKFLNRCGTDSNLHLV